MKHSFRQSENYRFFASWLIIIVYLLSLGIDCFCTKDNCVLGIGALLLGILGLFTGDTAISWLANPFFIAAVILTFRGSKYSIVVSMAAMLFSLSFLLFNKVLKDEAGHYEEIQSLKLGYWLWISSMTMLVICNIVFKKAQEITDDRF